MSIELPEAQILAEQMNKELRGKRVNSCQMQDYERLQRIGFVNKDIRAFDQLVNGKIESVTSRGNVIRVKLDNDMNLLLAPEYGGRVAYYTNKETVPDKFHLKIDFNDGTMLTVRLTGMGIINALKDEELERSYIYKRDFSTEVPSPIDDKEFTFERFTELTRNRKETIKALLVDKDAVAVGLGNSAFQDIVYKARIHPKRKVSDLSNEEKRALYDAIKHVLHERIRLSGKSQFYDLYGKQGRYTAAISLNTKTCSVCGSPVEKIGVGGGYVYFCPKCQK